MSQVSFKETDFDLSVVFGFPSEKHLNVKTNIFFSFPLPLKLFVVSAKQKCTPFNVYSLQKDLILYVAFLPSLSSHLALQWQIIGQKK